MTKDETVSGDKLQIDQARRRLKGELTAIERATSLTRKIGLVGLLIVVLYITFLYRQYNDILTPEFAVDWGVSLFEAHLSEAGLQVVDTIRGRLPRLLDNLEKTLHESLPLVRIKLTEEAGKKIDAPLLELIEAIPAGQTCHSRCCSSSFQL